MYVILHLVSKVPGIWALILNEEQRLLVSESGVLETTFVARKHGVPGAQRELHNEELHNLYASHDIKKGGTGGMRSTGK
jgi:hypothetical protein